MKHSERIPSLFFLALSLFICQQSVVIGVGSLSQPGPGLLAFGAGIAMGGLAFWFLIQSFVSKERRSKVVENGAALKKGRFLLICMSLFAYTIAVKWAGFLVSTFVFCIFIFYMIDSKKWWRLLIEAALITIGNYLFFVEWLGVSLPKGIYGW
jgi:putative tricarboxylic transport membrane protein